MGEFFFHLLRTGTSKQQYGPVLLLALPFTRILLTHGCGFKYSHTSQHGNPFKLSMGGAVHEL